MLASLAAYRLAPRAAAPPPLPDAALTPSLIMAQSLAQPLQLNGRPQLQPLPAAEEVWECEVAVVGGSLGEWRRRPTR